MRAAKENSMRPCLCALVCAFVATCPSTALAADPVPGGRSTAASTTRSIPSGAGRHGRTHGRAPANYADRRGAPVTRAVAPLRQQPHLQRHVAEPLLRERRHAVGRGVGPVPGPHVRAAPGDRRRARAARATTPPTRSRRSATTSARSPSSARRRRPGRAPSSTRQQLNTVSGYIDALQRLRRHGRAAGVAARGPGHGDEGEQRRHAAAPPAATCRGADARGDAADRARHGPRRAA